MTNRTLRDIFSSSSQVSSGSNPSSGNGVGPPCVIELSTTNDCTAHAQQTTECAHRTCCACHHVNMQTTRRSAIGIVLMALGAVSWVGVSICGEKTYRGSEFHAPFFVVYFVVSSLVVFYPVHICARIIRTRADFNIKESIRDSFRVYREEGLGAAPYKAAGKVLVFCCFWTVTSYVYIRALRLQSVLNVMVLFATNSNFMYLMSWIVLQKMFIATRIVALIVSMTGVIFITYVDSGFASDAMWGSVLAVLATGCSAVYKVTFKRVMGEITCDQVACLLSGIGLCNLLTMWPIVLLLWLTNAEPLDWNKVPWQMILGASIFTLVLSFLMHYGSLVTYNIMIQTSFVLAVPICAVAIAVLDGMENAQVKGLQIGAYILIALGFTMSILPAESYKAFLKAIHWKSSDVTRNRAEGHMTPRQRVRMRSLND